MIYRRQRYISLHTLLKFLLLGKIRWNAIGFVRDLGNPLPVTAVLALSMSQVTTGRISTTSATNIRSICNCGSVVVDVYFDQNDNTASAINCHCEGCRRYHTGPFTSFLKTDESRISIREGDDKIGKFSSNCNELGPVERWFCMDCSSKILSVPRPLSSYSDDNAVEDKHNTNSNRKENAGNEETCIPKAKRKPVSKCFVNLGPVVEDGISPTITGDWKEQLERIENNLHFDNASGVWVRARPECNADDNNDPKALNTSLTWSGGCSCGACRYELTLNRPTQIQHCYCHLCRTKLGSPFMSWIPVEKKDFRWKKIGVQEEGGVQRSPSLQIVRTTPFGCRHICKNCKSVMTIVYDEQPDLIWPCARSLDDSSLPNDTTEMGKCLSRVCHICCRYYPTWLKIRDDGLERIEEAC
jgi:hypothetical protein